MDTEKHESSAEQSSSSPSAGLSALRRFTQPRPAAERCELCGTPLASAHPHLLDTSARQIACACDACAILFCGQEGGKFLRVPRRVKQLHDFAFSELEWEAMMLPIHLAFFFRDRTGRVTGMYPSPAGAIESQLGLGALRERIAAHPLLRTMEPEVEALLVNRVGDEAACLLVPIDECYRLVGLIRMQWRGLSGGPQIWGAIAEFFRAMKLTAGEGQRGHHA